MKSSILLRAISAIAMIGALCANTKANEGTLLLDGRILVENGSSDDAVVTVMQDAVELSKLTLFAGGAVNVQLAEVSE